MALASAATDADERSALEWTSLRADAHPSFDSLATFLKAHPGWPSRAWIRELEEAQLAAHPQAPGQVAAFFANDPPQSSAGKIAAARAAQAMGRPEEASQIIRALWRDGNVDALSESVVLREFGSSLTKADHVYRAGRLFYAGYLSAGARAAALAGPDFLALAQARIGAARAPMSPGLIKAVPPALRNDPVSCFPDSVRPPRRAGLRAAVLLSSRPRSRALASPDRWWSGGRWRPRFDLDDRGNWSATRRSTPLVRGQVDAAFHAG
jgi:soluble lytic murein transglycosylase